MDKNQKKQEVFDEKNGKMVPVYTNNDFVRALKERFPDGIELGIGWLQEHHVNNYLCHDNFNGYDAIDTVVGREAAFDNDYLEARIKLQPEDYDLLEPGQIDLTDPDWVAAFHTPGYNPDDLWATSIMNENPDLKGAPVIVPQDLAVKRMVIEGTHIHDLMAMVLKNPDMDTATMKDLCQLHAVYMRGDAFFKEGWAVSPSVKKRVIDRQNTLPVGQTLRKLAEEGMENMNVRGYEPKTFKVHIGQLHFPAGDTGADRQKNLDWLANKYNEAYTDDHLMCKTAYAVHPQDTDYLLVNVNTVRPGRHMQAVDRINSLPSVKQVEEIPFQNILEYKPYVQESILDIWKNLANKVQQEKKTPPLMHYINNGGIYLHEKGKLGYAHISTDRTLSVNGEPLTWEHSQFVMNLAVRGNMALHRGGLQHLKPSCMLLCEPQEAERRLMIDKVDGLARRITVQTAIDGKQYLTMGTRMLDSNQYMDVEGRVTGATVYGKEDRRFIRAEIDGVQQPGRLLLKKDVQLLGQEKDCQGKVAQNLIDRLAAEYYRAELEQGPEIQQSRGVSR